MREKELKPCPFCGGEANFKNVGIDINVANELLKPRADLYKAINPETTVVCGDITKEEIYNKIISSCMDKE